MLISAQGLYSVDLDDRTKVPPMARRDGLPEVVQ